MGTVDVRVAWCWRGGGIHSCVIQGTGDERETKKETGRVDTEEKKEQKRKKTRERRKRRRKYEGK
jgi:hypothetical protein